MVRKREKEDMGDEWSEGMGIREQIEKNMNRTGISPTFDTSSPTHINTYTDTYTRDKE